MKEVVTITLVVESPAQGGILLFGVLTPTTRLKDGSLLPDSRSVVMRADPWSRAGLEALGCAGVLELRTPVLLEGSGISDDMDTCMLCHGQCGDNVWVGYLHVDLN